ncbi:MAG TPA: glycosyltransferase family 1 protein, partial [Bryobacteraceae bacterium]|nr:glycosyltransferase family 1 protein [Bryobacteraceae bacterium]
LDCLFNPGFTTPVLARCPHVTVFHDLQHKRHPEFFRWWDLPFWRIFLRASATTSQHLIAVSEATKRDLLHFYGLPEERITVVPHGVDQAFLTMQPEPDRERPYLLCVSTLHPHKNIERLVEVFSQLRLERPELRLVLAGMRGFHAETVERKIEELGLRDSVEITGWISQERLHELYRQASAFVYPSTFEGFGMPVLEAMAAGVPLACSSIEPLRALADGVAELFPPDDSDAMLRAVRDALAGYSAVRARVRAAQLTWEACAEKTLSVLIEQSGGRRGAVGDAAATLPPAPSGAHTRQH